MGRINAKAKGNAFERTVAGKLSDWWGVELIRVPNSGAMASQGFVGDIMQKDPRQGFFPFVVECKAQEGWSLDQLILSPELSPLARFAQQACKACTPDVFPLLVAKRNRVAPIALIFLLPHVRETVDFALTDLSRATVRLWCGNGFGRAHVFSLPELMEIAPEKIEEILFR